jgi:hypothetical protein
LISLFEVKNALEIKYDIQDLDLVSKALLGLHGFTGCDTISAFSGKGKVKPLQLMLKNDVYCDLFASLGTEPELPEDLILENNLLVNCMDTRKKIQTSSVTSSTLLRKDIWIPNSPSLYR